MKKIVLTLSAFILTLAVGLSLEISAGEAMEGHGHDSGNKMMQSLSSLKNKDFDIAFYSMMIPHHQAAVAMAQRVNDTTQDLQVKKWSTDIITTQTAEIETMKNALGALGGSDTIFYEAMGTEMAPMIEATQGDRSFVEQMIPHHASAVEMAKMAPEHTSTPEILALSKAIIEAQTREIDEFNAWLKAHPEKR